MGGGREGVKESDTKKKLHLKNRFLKCQEIRLYESKKIKFASQLWQFSVLGSTTQIYNSMEA